MTQQLHVAPGFTLPIDVITQKTSILARTGAGKTNAGVVICEELLDRKQQIVVLDPKGDWYGLRASADGEGEGYPVIVMGGLHGDVPLEPTGGHLVADFIVDTRSSVVLDVSQFSKQELYRFVAEFCDWFYRRQAKDPHPVLLVLEEADEVCPQFVSGKTAAMVGAVEKVAKRGRFIGIGFLALTQRSASFNKDVLTQTEVLIAMQTTAPQDMKAIDEWIKHHPDQDKREELLSKIQSLKVGEAYVWSPSWLEVFKPIRFRLRKTFDAGRTPKVGEKRVEPKKLAPVDLEALKTKMAATVEKARLEDPRQLRKTIADLRQQLARAHQPAPASTPKEIRVEVPVLKDAHVKALERLGERFEAIAAKTTEAALALRGAVRDAMGARAPSLPLVRPVPRPQPAPRPRPAPVANADPEASNGEVTGPMQRILDALAWLESIGVQEPDQPAVAFLAGYTTGGGAYNNPRGRLNQLGLIRYLPGDRLALTDAGRQVANAPAAPLSTEELHRRVLERLPGPEQKLLRVLLAAYPNPVTNEDLAAQAGYEPGGGAFNNPRGRLRSLGLIDYPDRGLVVAKPLLFLEDNLKA
jgi:uncharacterized protein